MRYGIQTEGSTWRAHVCFVVGCCYCFRTKAALATLHSREYPEKKVLTEGICTAIGYLVPPEDIPGCREIEIPTGLLQMSTPQEKDSTTAKGAAAVDVVIGLLRSGLFPISVAGEEVEDREIQVNGLDVVVASWVYLKIQVKCDYWGGSKSRMGTGNLFLQVAECNPFGRF